MYKKLLDEYLEMLEDRRKIKNKEIIRSIEKRIIHENIFIDNLHDRDFLSTIQYNNLLFVLSKIYFYED